MQSPEGLEDTPLKSCKPHEKQNKINQNTRSIGEKLKTKSLMFFVSCTVEGNRGLVGGS